MNKDEFKRNMREECTALSCDLTIEDVIDKTLEWAAQGQEPVAVMWQQEETGQTDFVDMQQVEWGFFKNNPRLQEICKVYQYPAPRVVPDKFNDEQLSSLIKGLGFTNLGPFSIKIANAVQSVVRKQFGVDDE